ncbi:hypothetical protein phytr_1930 [Candidatus Phycorickettsia trachydisci]|uniref:Uncharacterized protein n=1 Tax=Candidatus Phycorickettsia trachydisci TaxID=2115978 RepID=A0A2P1P7A6_9RICK|nr:hypothetical protein phytr_1930 [Candidatus Phycorickettsia trachydisci]
MTGISLYFSAQLSAGILAADSNSFFTSCCLYCCFSLLIPNKLIVTMTMSKSHLDLKKSFLNILLRYNNLFILDDTDYIHNLIETSRLPSIHQQQELNVKNAIIEKYESDSNFISISLFSEIRAL